MFESEFARTEYIAKGNAVLHVWKKEAHYDDYREPVIASLEMLRRHSGSIFIVDARNSFEDAPEDAEWVSRFFLPELKKTECRIWGFILPDISEIEGETDLRAAEIEKSFTVIRAGSYEDIISQAQEILLKQHSPAAIQLLPLEASDREQFIRDNQDAFNYGALEEFGQRDDRFEEDGEIISYDTVSRAIDNGTAYRIMQDGKPVGGVVVRTEYDHGELELLFVSPAVHNKGIGYAAWQRIEDMHPEVTVWETVTPYFEKRNIHFYINRCGFQIVEFFNSHHIDPNDEDGEMSEMFRFEKILPATPESVQEQIKRITYYENIMEQAADGSPELLRMLSDYYSSAAWKRDFAADEAGSLPTDLKRGVLSEDGIYNLLEE